MNYMRIEQRKRIISVIRDIEILRAEALQPSSERHHDECVRKINAYEKVWEEADDYVRDVIKLRFHEGKKYHEMTELYYSIRSKKRMCTRFVRKLGEELGEI